jgi:hypothetical protein
MTFPNYKNSKQADANQIPYQTIFKIKCAEATKKKIIEITIIL